MVAGVVVLDANVVRRLEDPILRDRLAVKLEVAGLRVQPTGMTVLELAATPDPGLRFRLLDTLAVLSKEAFVRPMPTQVLEWTGRMICADRASFEWPSSGMEAVLYDRGVGHEALVRAGPEHLKEQQADFDAMCTRARVHFRETLLRQGSVDPWRDIPAFLDTQWTKAEFLETEIRDAWTELELPGTPDARRILKDEAWRLFFEGFGAAVYERCVRSQTQRPVHVADLRQLVYLAGSHRRLLVTDDEPLIRLAGAVLNGRYDDARVIRSNELLAMAS
jgi:hypothetical protein